MTAENSSIDKRQNENRA